MNPLQTENQYSCFSENEKYNVLLELISQRKNIYLYGSGNNGKTYILNRIRQSLNNVIEEYTVIYDDNIQIPNNRLFINETNIEPDNNMSDRIDVTVEFRGTWDPLNNMYV